MDESSIGLFIAILLTVGIIIAIICGCISNHEEEERKRQEEEEKKRNTMCCICGHCSMGQIVCDNCLDRSTPIKKELPLQKIKNYELLSKFQQETIDKAIFAPTKIDREFQCIRLIAIANLLEDKYHVLDVRQNTLTFFEDLAQEGYQTSDEFIAKYASKDRNLKNTSCDNDEDEQEDSEASDYRAKHEKPYRCADGDYVRSKAEREIDDFFFKNRIWHEYEAEYVNSETRQKYYPDFYLPDYTLYIEYFGLATEEYIEKRDHKIKMYRSDSSINFDYLTYEDDNNIYDKLKDICRKHNIPLK